MDRLGGGLRRTIVTAGPIIFCLVLLTILISVFLQTDTGTTHRAAELLIFPAAVATVICLVRLGFGLLERLSFLRRGRWGFDPHSGGFYGEYGVDFQTTSGSGRRRRRRSRR